MDVHFLGVCLAVKKNSFARYRVEARMTFLILLLFQVTHVGVLFLPFPHSDDSQESVGFLFLLLPL